MIEELVEEMPACRCTPKDLPLFQETTLCVVRVDFPTSWLDKPVSPEPFTTLPTQEGVLLPSEMLVHVHGTIRCTVLYRADP